MQGKMNDPAAPISGIYAALQQATGYQQMIFSILTQPRDAGFSLRYIKLTAGN